MSDSATPQTAVLQASLSITNSWSPPKPMSIESVTLSNHVILCRPLLLPSIFPSISGFSNELALYIRWPKHWSFSFSISFSNEYSELFPLGLTGLISLLSKALSQVFSSNTVGRHQFFWHSAIFTVQLSQPYVTTGKTIALTIWTFVSKVMFLLSNTLSRFVIAFLPRNKVF